MKHFLVGLIGAAFMLSLFWFGGFDFNERGAVAVACFAMTSFTSIFVSAASADIYDRGADTNSHHDPN